MSTRRKSTFMNLNIETAMKNETSPSSSAQMSHGLSKYPVGSRKTGVTTLCRTGCCMVNAMRSWQYHKQTRCTSWGHDSEVGEVCRQRPLWMWWCGYSSGHRLCGKHKEGPAESHGSPCSQRQDSPSISFCSFIPSLFLFMAGPVYRTSLCILLLMLI